MASELDLYIQNQRNLVREYCGKIIALHNGEVQGVFASKVEALAEMKKKFSPGEFLIIKCMPGDEEYTRRYRSRVLCGATTI